MEPRTRAQTPSPSPTGGPTDPGLGRVIEPVSWRIWSSKWVTASSCMTWPPRTNSRRPSATSWRTLAWWAERKGQVTCPGLSQLCFLGTCLEHLMVLPSNSSASFLLQIAGHCLSWSALCPALRTGPGHACCFIKCTYRYICSHLLLLNDAKIMGNLWKSYPELP